MLSLNKKVKTLMLLRKEKQLYAEAAKIYSKDESSICEVVKKKEKKIHAGFAVALQKL